MAAIFPPVDKGGIPPGPNAPNGYTPVHSVVGEGPLYASNDCTTILTVEQLNALTSEIAAAVDKLGYSYDTSKVTNLGDALLAVIGTGTGGYVQISGDVMTGPLILSADPTLPLEAATKQYAVARAGDTMTGFLTLSGNPTAPLHAAPKQYVDAADTALSVAYQNADNLLQGQIDALVTGGGGLPEAPTDGQPYGRRNSAWVDVVEEVPTDGFFYSRRNGSWVVAPDLSTGKVNKTGDVMTGLLTLSGDPTSALHAATKQYVDAGTIPQNSQSAAYTTVLADAGKHILHPSADTTARTITIASNASVAYLIGTSITFVNQDAAGVLTIAIASDTMRLAGAGTTGSRTLAANGIATALKITATEWIIHGTGLT